ncbi:MAG: 16S rRNA (uracil(1498)-N(3))-methyltransferase [Proteobacteria bacterium]|nr:16S rRNA (uracil(1498)-N(3))-methyltransferase [Pseudomonadota bacterium]
MILQDFASPRLFVDHPLAAESKVPLSPSQSHYLASVLRRKVGAPVLVFNGRDGEWRAEVAAQNRGAGVLRVIEQARRQTPPCDLHLLFAPLKHARLDYVVQKAVEMGVGSIRPVMTQRTQAARVNLARMRANVVEAAEQCGILALPPVDTPAPLALALKNLDAGRLLIFCDEAAPSGDPVAMLAQAFTKSTGGPASLAVLVGPEGGFTQDERLALLQRGNLVRLRLGPRILRADTAAVAALAVAQSVLGDWRFER